MKRDITVSFALDKNAKVTLVVSGVTDKDLIAHPELTKIVGDTIVKLLASGDAYGMTPPVSAEDREKMIRNPANYADNEIKWPIGSLVIHRFDAKEARMLMRVVGYVGDTDVITIYELDKARIKTIPRHYVNPLTELFDPVKFGILPEGYHATIESNS